MASSSVRLEESTALVLGAGFTKAFLPGAPLLVDDYDCESLLRQFQAFPTARAILQYECGKPHPGLIDLERALSRASSGMPYDSDTGASEELALLSVKLKEAFQSRLDAARRGKLYADELGALARLVAERGIDCVTFNYDDLLDEALHSVKPRTGGSYPPNAWNPDGGYGFFCRPAISILREGQTARMEESDMLLLKLHGSVNWRVRLGYAQQHSVDAIVHYEKWSRYPTDMSPEPEEFEQHLEPSPFIVPPILGKESLVYEPVLRLVWARARRTLRKAGLVVFIGYSLPVTDLASRFLFTEAIRPEARVLVVSLARTKTQQKELRANYRGVFPDIRYDEFRFDGALSWSQALVDKYL